VLLALEKRRRARLFGTGEVAGSNPVASIFLTTLGAPAEVDRALRVCFAARCCVATPTSAKRSTWIEASGPCTRTSAHQREEATFHEARAAYQVID